MNQERLCLECDKSFPRNKMIKGTKTNSYGDQIQEGYLCQTCFRRRVENRSRIFLLATAGFGILSLLLFLTIPLYLLVVQVYIEENVKYITETFLSSGVIMAIIAIIMFLVRKRELKKMESELLSK